MSPGLGPPLSRMSVVTIQEIRVCFQTTDHARLRVTGRVSPATALVYTSPGDLEPVPSAHAGVIGLIPRFVTTC